MSWGYPDGCTQADHDRAFGELGPWNPAERDYDPYEEDPDPDRDHDYDYPEESE